MCPVITKGVWMAVDKNMFSSAICSKVQPSYMNQFCIYHGYIQYHPLTLDLFQQNIQASWTMYRVFRVIPVPPPTPDHTITITYSYVYQPSTPYEMNIKEVHADNFWIRYCYPLSNLVINICACKSCEQITHDREAVEIIFIYLIKHMHIVPSYTTYYT